MASTKYLICKPKEGGVKASSEWERKKYQNKRSVRVGLLDKAANFFHRVEHAGARLAVHLKKRKLDEMERTIYIK
jgi:hypothetical protein